MLSVRNDIITRTFVDVYDFRNIVSYCHESAFAKCKVKRREKLSGTLLGNYNYSFRLLAASSHKST